MRRGAQQLLRLTRQFPEQILLYVFGHVGEKGAIGTCTRRHIGNKSRNRRAEWPLQSDIVDDKNEQWIRLGRIAVSPTNDFCAEPVGKQCSRRSSAFRHISPRLTWVTKL